MVIHKLPESLANKIAAGEVVQRPESVVKELVENAIDAGATEIAVITKSGGKALVFVSDNGGGMSQDDAVACFERHATSKISTLADLDRIMTLGFRGEALAAIASVAQVELRTRLSGEELGTIVRVESGRVLDTRKTSCEVGTSISVKNLFFSVPARRKFLKSNATEFKHIVETMQRFALCYPNVSFTLSDDDALAMNVNSGTIEKRIEELYNQQMLNALLPLNAVEGGLSVSGFIGRPNFSRKSRSDQFLFVNGRIINSKSLSHAVYSGYEHLMDAQSYPPYIIFLDIDPERVDVNVHPTKAEVKFEDESTVYRLLLTATKQTLSDHNLTPVMTMSTPDETGESVLSALRFALPQYDRAQRFPDQPSEQYPTPSSRAEHSQNPSYERRETAHHDLTGKALLDKLFGESSNFAASQSRVRETSPWSTLARDAHVGLWQLHKKYIVTQITSGMMIIDQHVAHERILYEQALRQMSSEKPVSQQLLFPIAMEAPPAERALIMEVREELANLGFDLDVSNPAAIQIRGVPGDVRAGQESTILQELLDQYREYQRMGKTDQLDLIAASYSCRAALKAGEELSEPEMRSLIESLFATSMPYVCPHGRPIVIRLDLLELDRRFGRTS